MVGPTRDSSHFGLHSPQRANTTLWVSSGQPLLLIATLTDEGTASGDLFWDDGETIDTYETNQYAYVVFDVARVR